MAIRKTKIICTIGPAVESEEKIKALISAGIDAARFNFSHGSHEEHKARIDLVKKVSKEMNAPIALILDTKGPEIRVCDFAEKKVELVEGQSFTLYKDPTHIGDVNGVGITYPYLSEDVKPGTTILIDDGLISMTVTDIVNGDMVCQVENGGKVSSKKSINIPGVDVDQVFISEKDRSDIIFDIEQDIDFIAASFVRNQDDVKKLRKLLNVNGCQKVQIIAKIENGSGIDNLDSILEIADGVMIARGDMGVEVPFDHLPSIQKNSIKKCYKKERIVLKAKAIVVATVSGYTAHIASYYRPSVPIIASCTDEKATKQLKLDYGVYPYHVDLTNDRDVMRTQALQIARASKVVEKGDLVVLICGSLNSGTSTSDTMIIAEA